MIGFTKNSSALSLKNADCKDNSSNFISKNKRVFLMEAHFLFNLSIKHFTRINVPD